MRRSPRPWKEYGRYGTVGIELVLSIVVGYWAGHWLDGKVGGGHGWLTVAGSLLGVYAGFRALFAAAAYMERDVARAERRERGENAWPEPPEPPSPEPDPAPNSKNEKHHVDR